jgi:hypothetical protein
MSNSLNATCWVCGKKYNHCFKCKDLAGYRAVADTPECYQICSIIREYREGIIKATEAKQKFENIGITLNCSFSNILPEVVRDIRMIIGLGTEKTDIKTEKIKENKK